MLAATWGMSTQCLGAIKRKGAVLGIAFHGSDLTRLTEAPEDLQEVVDAATALLPVSNFLASELLRLGLVQPGDPRVRVLPIPLAEQPPARQGTGLVCVARPTPLKGIERVQALAAALELPLTLVGPDSSQGGTGLLTRSQTREAMAQAAAAVLLPRTDEDGLGAEGLGIVLLEAAAMGLVVIGCSTGGVPEAVGPGLLVDPEWRPAPGCAHTTGRVRLWACCSRLWREAAPPVPAPTARPAGTGDPGSPHLPRPGMCWIRGHPAR